jgi:hypothetical protein
MAGLAASLRARVEQQLELPQLWQGGMMARRHAMVDLHAARACCCPNQLHSKHRRSGDIILEWQLLNHSAVFVCYSVDTLPVFCCITGAASSKCCQSSPLAKQHVLTQQSILNTATAGPAALALLLSCKAPS